MHNPTLLYNVVNLVQALFNFYSFLILAYCLLSWLPIRLGGIMGDIVAVLQGVVGPYLDLFRRFLPPMGGIDWSPVLAIVVLNLLESLVTRLILQVL